MFGIILFLWPFTFYICSVHSGTQDSTKEDRIFPMGKGYMEKISGSFSWYLSLDGASYGVHIWSAKSSLEEPGRSPSTEIEQRGQIGRWLCVVSLHSLFPLWHFGKLGEFSWKARLKKKKMLTFDVSELPSRNTGLCWFNVATSFVRRGVILNGHQKHHMFFH